MHDCILTIAQAEPYEVDPREENVLGLSWVMHWHSLCEVCGLGIRVEGLGFRVLGLEV